MTNWANMSTADFVREIPRQGINAFKELARDWDKLPWRLKLAFYIAYTEIGKHIIRSYNYDQAWWEVVSKEAAEVIKEDDLKVLKLEAGSRLGQLEPRLMQDNIIWEFLECNISELEWRAMAGQKLEELKKVQKEEREWVPTAAELATPLDKALSLRAKWNSILSDEEAELTDEEWEEAWVVTFQYPVLGHPKVPIHLLEKWMKEENGRYNFYILSHTLGTSYPYPTSWLDWALESQNGELIESALADERVPMEVRRKYRKSQDDDVCMTAWGYGEISEKEKKGPISLIGLWAWAGREDLDDSMYERILSGNAGEALVNKKLPRWVRLRLVQMGLCIYNLQEEGMGSEILNTMVKKGNKLALAEMADYIIPEWGPEIARKLLEKLVKNQADVGQVIRVIRVGQIVLDKALVKLLIHSKSKEIREEGIKLAGQLGQAKQAEDAVRKKGRKRV